MVERKVSERGRQLPGCERIENPERLEFLTEWRRFKNLFRVAMMQESSRQLRRDVYSGHESGTRLEEAEAALERLPEPSRLRQLGEERRRRNGDSTTADTSSPFEN